MELGQIVTGLKKKNLIILGLSKADRKSMLDQLEVELASQTFYRISTSIMNLMQYVDEVRSNFPFIPAGCTKSKKYWKNVNRVMDFHLDWTMYEKNISIVLEDVDGIEDEWKYEIINDYITQSYRNEEESYQFCLKLSVILFFIYPISSLKILTLAKAKPAFFALNLNN